MLGTQSNHKRQDQHEFVNVIRKDIHDKNPYDRFRRDELILRDVLAIDRTILSNERTVLAYLRSALTLFIVG